MANPMAGGVIIVVVVIIAVILYVALRSKSFRPFEASHDRAAKILAKTQGRVESFANYRSAVGGDAVEFKVVRDLANNGSLNVNSLTQSLLPYDSYYASSR
jgi:hypothetical protein